MRNDPRGLKAIFADPENGNYDLANTPEGRLVDALKAGMTTPPSCFLQKPSYEDAAAYIKSSKIFSVNTCRNPCQQNTLRINNTFNVNAASDRKVAVTWTLSEQQNIDHHEIEKAIGNNVFKRMSLIPITTDSSYSFTDDIQPGITYQYRLVVIASAGGRCYSGVRSIKTNNENPFTVYPNPSKGKITVSMNGYVGPVNCTLCNLLGQAIWKKESVSLYAPQQLDISGKPRGVYLLKVETSKGINIQKIIMQ
ncbi:MAG: T9SS type A sorting domain-containing protein [Bacteroidota bacterium]|nr:T9SS type A sorting domain-containing protein [Bacteroidota bacterium]